MKQWNAFSAIQQQQQWIKFELRQHWQQFVMQQPAKQEPWTHVTCYHVWTHLFLTPFWYCIIIHTSHQGLLRFHLDFLKERPLEGTVFNRTFCYMFSQVWSRCKCLATFRAAERFITCMGSFMGLQITWSWAFVVTLGAAEGFITSVDPFMSPEIT